MRFCKLVFLLQIMFINSEIYTFEEGIAKNGDVEIFYRDYGPIDGDPILLSLIHI